MLGWSISNLILTFIMRKDIPVLLLAASLSLAGCGSGPQQPIQPKRPEQPAAPVRPVRPTQPKPPKPPPSAPGDLAKT